MKKNMIGSFQINLSFIIFKILPLGIQYFNAMPIIHVRKIIIIGVFAIFQM